MTLASRAQNVASALRDLADAIGAPKAGHSQILHQPFAPSGPLNPQLVGVTIARHLPEGAIICDDGVTSSGSVAGQTTMAAPHEVLALTGGAIGIGLPLAVGAAVAPPGRKVVALTGDGSAMYTIQALWTLARESLETVVVFVNNAYRILNIEMARTGAGAAGPKAADLLV